MEGYAGYAGLEQAGQALNELRNISIRERVEGLVKQTEELADQACSIADGIFGAGPKQVGEAYPPPSSLPLVELIGQLEANVAHLRSEIQRIGRSF